MYSNIRIDILLATYNGARFLREQLDSLLGQTHKDWRVIARDDKSSDATPDILEEYARAYPEHFLIIPGRERLGAKKSFSFLMQHVGASYVAFCDQDDFWCPEKLTVLLERMLETEGSYEETVPVLIHSDLEVVNQQMERMASSFWGYQGVDPARNRLGNLLIENTVTGCAMLMNRALLEKAMPIPDAAYMHDYWLALVASATGRIVFTREALVRYRQHSSNTLGTVKIPGLLFLLGGALNPANWKISYRVACNQALALNSALSDVSLPERLAPALRFAKLYEHGWLGRRWILVSNSSLPSRWRRRISVLVRI